MAFDTVETVVMPASAPDALDRAVRLLRAGQLVAYPTDTLYGLGALVSDERALARMLWAKGRAAERGVPVLIAHESQAGELVLGVDEKARALMAAFWPGQLTLVFKKKPEVSELVAGPGGTLALRVPGHAVTLALLRRAAGPMTGTSANLTGGRPPATAQDVVQELSGRVALVLDAGPSPVGLASTVLDLSGPRPKGIRWGAISREALEQALGESII